MPEPALKAARCSSQVFAGFCALTETPIQGAGNDAINSHGIWSNANNHFGQTQTTTLEGSYDIQ
jgi:hypothetical protein